MTDEQADCPQHFGEGCPLCEGTGIVDGAVAGAFRLRGWEGVCAIGAFTPADKPALLPGGEWLFEPDEIKWTDHGFACAVLRNPMVGTWLGYVQVPKGHPWHGRDASYSDGGMDAAVHTIEVHGGITYGGERFDNGGWWLGFDFNHGMDKMVRNWRLADDGSPIPGVADDDPLRDMGGTYRNLGYVLTQVLGVVAQACKAGQ